MQLEDSTIINIPAPRVIRLENIMSFMGGYCQTSRIKVLN